MTIQWWREHWSELWLDPTFSKGGATRAEFPKQLGRVPSNHSWQAAKRGIGKEVEGPRNREASELNPLSSELIGQGRLSIIYAAFMLVLFTQTFAGSGHWSIPTWTANFPKCQLLISLSWGKRFWQAHRKEWRSVAQTLQFSNTFLNGFLFAFW